MSVEAIIKKALNDAFSNLYQAETADLKLEKTKPEFEGDFTFVVFPFLKTSKKSPEVTAQELGTYLEKNCPEVQAFNVIKGFLNLVVSDSYWLSFASEKLTDPKQLAYSSVGKGKKVMVEYSSPNTNKPLHLGHVRNNLLGYSVSQILEHNGYEVIKANLINDRGIHICKSMIAWMRFGNGETPASSGLKGDHLVGKYYVEFDKAYKAEVAALEAGGMNKEEAEKKAPLLQEAQNLLRLWEASDKATIDTWKMMNDWVYAGFNTTYKRLGVEFDKFYYESDTYVLGKSLVDEGLEKGVLYKKDDGSVWIDLEGDGLDQKLLLRSDGTSVYMTQDLGTAQHKYDEFGMERSVYVVGNEQDYHFKVLFLILKKLGKTYADGMYHLSYGMVDLPSGKMKSREGTVVDADMLMDDMHHTAEQITSELGKTEGLNAEELNSLYENIGLGALKYYLLKVDPVKRIMFDPKESIDFQGNTGPFLQYTYARICSLLNNAGSWKFDKQPAGLEVQEKELIRTMHELPLVVENAGQNYSPAVIANYTYDLVKAYNRFYHDCPILKEENTEVKNFRLQLSFASGELIRACFDMLGIPVVNRM